ncbi:MAG: glycosyltransferase [Solirubrobacterales bacterium]
MERPGEGLPEPRVSVVIASYRWPAALRLTIESALAQTVREVEVIVVEDGLDTGSRGVVRAIGDQRVRWHRKWFRSGSQTGPNEKGRRLARAPVVAYLGHDDIWAPDHLEGLLEAFATGADLVHSTTLMLGSPTGDLIAGSRPFTPDHFVPPSSMAHLRDSPRIARWPVSASITPQVDWHFFNSCFRLGAGIAVSGRPTTLKYPATWSSVAFRKRDCSRQEELVRQLARDPDLGRRLEAEIMASGAEPVLAGNPDKSPAPSSAGGWGRRQKGFHGRFGLRSYRWQRSAVIGDFPGWGILEDDPEGRPLSEAAPDGSSRVRFDTPRRPWTRIRAEVAAHSQTSDWVLTVDGRPLSTSVEGPAERGGVHLVASRRLWRRGRAPVIDVGLASRIPDRTSIPVFRIWLGRWPAGSDVHSRFWAVRRTAIRLLRSRLGGR